MCGRLPVTNLEQGGNSCLILCTPMDCSLPRSSVHGVLQAGILELDRNWKGDQHSLSPCQASGTVLVAFTSPISPFERQGFYVGQEDLNLSLGTTLCSPRHPEQIPQHLEALVFSSVKRG